MSHSPGERGVVFQEPLFGTIPDRVAEEAPCSVPLVHKYEPAPISNVRCILKRMRGRIA